MMGLYVNRKDPGEAMVRNLVAIAEGGKSEMGSGGGIVGEGKNKDGTKRDFAAKGTQAPIIEKALKLLRPPIDVVSLSDATTTQAMKDELKTASAKNPWIVGVTWSNGTQHVVMAIDYDTDKNKIIVADPYFGLGTISLDGSYVTSTGAKGNVVLVMSKK